MAALATLADLRARLAVELPVADETRAEALLDDVSEAARAATGQRITGGSPTDRVRVRLGRAILPQRHASVVTTITNIDGDTLTGWTWDGLQDVTGLGDFDVVDITYTHAYSATTLTAVTGIVATAAARAYGRPPEARSPQGEQVDAYALATGATASGGWGLLANERRTLRRLLGISNAKSIGTVFV